MALTRSQFYVDTPPPRDPTQRYSMFADHSELARASAAQDLSSTSSSATLPSAAGSVDRLTGLGEKKSSRFFTLKPKTSFSLRPFFSSTSISNLSPSKQRRRKAGEVSTPRRDSYVQTEDDRRAYDEVGVQTLNASTVDVPVQTCSIEWEAGDSYGYRRLPGPAAYRPGYSRYPSGGYSTNLFTPAVSKPPGTALEKTSAAENSFVSPLVTSRLLKYAAPDDSPSSSEKTSLSSQSTATSASALGGVIKNVESADPQKASAALSERSTAPSVPVKYFSAKELVSDPASTTALTSEDTKECTDKKSSTDILDVSCVTADETNSNLIRANAIGSEVTLNPDSRAKSEKQVKISDIDKIKDLSNESKISAPRPAGSPASVLKVDRTSSPSKQHSKVKSVHFDLLDSDERLSPPEKRKDSSKPRNVDKDFEALLRDLDILTDEPEEKVKPLSAGVPEQSTIDVSTTEQAEKVPTVLEVRRSSWSTTQPKILNDALKISPSNSVIISQTKPSDDSESRQCDFTNCLRPSQIQNSPFLAKIRSRSASPGLSPDLSSPQFKNNISAVASDIKNDSSKAVGQCDYASCLKPSQAQNSVFSAELSEITANKSSNIINASLRTNTSLTARPDSPVVKRANALISGNQEIAAYNVDKNSVSAEEVVPQVKHKSEVFIMLQPPHANDATVPGGDSHLQNTSPSQQSSASLESQSDPHSESLDTLEKSEHPMPQSADFQQSKILPEIPQTTLESLASPPPPPPPPPLPGIKSCLAFDKNINNTSSMESMIREQHSNLIKPQITNDIKPSTPKTAMMLELEKRFESKSKMNSGNQVPLSVEGDTTNYGDTSISSFPDSGKL
ncbi:uncharacterized protein LOC118183324, partial [Stegodyphus dumicola]|uniref:uncharacterized protein LOC118183324 n=1 Tax=Stegodyphus dumicola TaxID=202533 RepID=UPI0015AA0F08